MAGGLTGRQGAAAYAKSSTWGTAASVTKQIHLRSTEGLDSQPNIIDDEVFNQDYLGSAEIGDENPRIQDITMTLRYEDTDEWLAAVMGSPAAPTAVGSQGAADSLVSQSHVIDLATNPSHFFTLATAYGEEDTHYVQEVTTMRPRGFTVTTGDGGVLEVSFACVGNKTIYDSAINTNSTVYGASAANIAFRVMRKQGVFRLNVQGDAALDATDTHSAAREIEWGMSRPVMEDGFVYGQDYIAEPCDNGPAEFPLNITYVHANTITLNSMVGHLKTAGNFKCDLTLTSNTFINSADQRSMLVEWPNVQLMEFSAPITGHGLIEVTASMRGKLASTSPSGMAFVNPMRMTIVNANSNTMLS